MVPSEPEDLTELLNRASSDSPGDYNRLAEVVYGELRRIAARLMRSGGPDRSMQPTEMADEAFVRLTEGNKGTWESRAHFYAVAAQAMRRILVDNSRRRNAQKRGGLLRRVDLSAAADVVVDSPEDLIALDEALDRLAAIDKRQSEIVVLRYFGGLTEEETAAAMNIGLRTVKRDWSVARIWLHAELSRRSARYPS